MLKGIIGCILEFSKAKEFINIIEIWYVISKKALDSTLMNKLSSMKLIGNNGVYECIMEMRDITT